MVIEWTTGSSANDRELRKMHYDQFFRVVVFVDYYDDNNDDDDDDGRGCCVKTVIPLHIAYI